jgi:hypothetical protein
MRVGLGCVALVVLLAGCAQAETPHVATAQSSSAPASTGSPAPSPTKLSDYDKALQYTRCLTAHGAPTDDPVVGVSLTAFNEFGPGVDLDYVNARRHAHELCKQLLPATWPVKLDPAEVARSAKYVDCMVKRGMPEPVPDAQGIINEPTDDSLSSTPGYDAAVAACRYLVDDKANGQDGN